MAIVEMRKMFLVGLEDDKEKILKALQDTGSVEISLVNDSQENDINKLMKRNEDPSKLNSLENQITEVRFALDFLGMYNKEKKGMFRTRHQISLDELNDYLDRQEEIFRTVNDCRKLDETLTDLKTRETRLNNIIVQLEEWDGLDVPLEMIRDTKYTKNIIGTIDKDRAEAFESDLMSGNKNVFLKRVGQTKEETCYLIIYLKMEHEAVDDILKNYGFSRVSFSDMQGTTRQVINNCKKEIDILNKERETVKEKALKLISHMKDLEILHDALSIEIEKQRASMNMLKTNKAFYLEGWIPDRVVAAVDSILSGITDTYYTEYREPLKDEVFPVALDNPALVEPFEMITSLYSTPHHRGIDPNIFMAPFYFAFFGMMVSDAGYGIILAIAAFLLTKKMKLKGGGRKLGLIISLGGVSTFLWGAIFGGWFGDAGASLGIPPIWFDPMDEPLLMLGLCFGLGLIQIFVGMGIQAYMNIKKGLVWDALFDQGLWYVLIIGLLLLFLPQTQNIGTLLSVLGAAGLVLTQGRNQTGLIKKLFSGITSLYNITGFLSDVLSYSRLFALGLATGVIAMVINQLGAMLGTSFITWIIAAVVLIGGHIFNILINVLGAFVHASRLQYIEFFGKFFEGGGHAFNPLAIKTKYIDIREREAV